MAKIKLIVLLILLGSVMGWAVDKNIEKYIETYQYIAISEMERSRVPASIKLAQGILESNAGRSVLARKANNHFGIKCGSRWKGKKYYRKDDDYKNGKLIKSCFRGYRNAETSFIAHSDFLLDNKRYRSLFRLDANDYKKWAKGLKKAGYATSRTYDKKLIRIIEEYKLFRYDAMVSSDLVADAKERIEEQREVFYINDAKMTFAKVGETPAAIAKRTQTSLSRILKYNEKITAANQPLRTDEKVFIQHKRRNFRGKQKAHIVKRGETMYDIAQSYGLCLEKLYKKNKMKMGTQPAVGESIRVRGKTKNRPKLHQGEIIVPPAPVLIEEPEVEMETEVETEEKEKLKPVITSPDRTHVPPKETEIPPVEKVEEIPAPVVTPPQIETRRYHIVVKGETLWRISQYYGKSVDDIKNLNGLTNNIISVGQRLRIE